jgi:signal transduction histidine kinase
MGMKFYNIVGEEETSDLKTKLARRRKGVREIYPLKMTKKNGDDIWLMVAAAPIYDRNDSYVGALSMLTDITRLKEVEDSLRRANESATIYLDLMAHDLNNMNQITMGYLEMADEKLQSEKNITVEDRSLIEKPLEEIKRASELIKNVRIIQQSKGEGAILKPVDLGAIIKDIIDTYSEIPEQKVTINYKGSRGCFVMANGFLRDVISNLVGNAIKHSGGSVAIDIDVGSVMKNDKRYYKVSIADNGPGIPDNIKEQLFHRLVRGRTMAKGSGLGLYLVKNLVENYHGQVWVEDSVPGDHTKGAKFVVMLPAA